MKMVVQVIVLEVVLVLARIHVMRDVKNHVTGNVRAIVPRAQVSVPVVKAAVVLDVHIRVQVYVAVIVLVHALVPVRGHVVIIVLAHVLAHVQLIVLQDVGQGARIAVNIPVKVVAKETVVELVKADVMQHV